MNPALAEALMAERARDRQTRAGWSRLARQARRTRHRTTPGQSLAAEGQPSCLQAASLRSA